MTLCPTPWKRNVNRTRKTLNAQVMIEPIAVANDTGIIRDLKA